MQKHLGIVKEEAEPCSTGTHHKEGGVVRGDKVTSKTDEAWVRAGDEDVGGSNAMTAIGARGVISGTGLKVIGVICMEHVTSNELEACGLKVTEALSKTPQSEVWEGASCRMGEDWVGQV